MVNAAKRVLVFDSGVGGLSVFDAIAASGKAFELDYAADNAWLPYGLKTDEQLRDRVPALLTRLAAQWAPEAVVVACNTASTIALEQVRAALNIPVVGVVPPIKPAAAATRTGVIGLLATPATVQRAYTNDLIAQFAGDKRVIRFGSAALVEAAERKLRGDDPDQSAITEAIGGLFGAPGGAEIDVVALACTHFPLLAAELADAAPRPCVWMDSGEAIARRLAHVLIAEEGAPRVRRAAFTSGDGARASLRAFETRGFSDFSHIAEAPSFALTSLARASQV
ncbi:MAG: glutamate racemase [Alphaproteobacteria bacterium]|nr:glutamate racemase [Alphaproteobacteria bacterium]